jgi:hypothetical protein
MISHSMMLYQNGDYDEAASLANTIFPTAPSSEILEVSTEKKPHFGHLSKLATGFRGNCPTFSAAMNL